MKTRNLFSQMTYNLTYKVQTKIIEGGKQKQKNGSKTTCAGVDFYRLFFRNLSYFKYLTNPRLFQVKRL